MDITWHFDMCLVTSKGVIYLDKLMRVRTFANAISYFYALSYCCEVRVGKVVGNLKGVVDP